METIKGYKFIQSDMKSKNGNHTWELGKWYKLDKDKIKLCEYGFHACLEPLQSLNFVYGDRFFIVEARGKIIENEDKFVASEMRLVKELPTSQIFKRFAIFCAKQCLPNYEKKYPNDSRINDRIKAAEDYLDGKITLDELSRMWSLAWSEEWSIIWSIARTLFSTVWASSEAVVMSVATSSPESVARSASMSARSASAAAELAVYSVIGAGSLWLTAELAQNEFLKNIIDILLRILNH